MRVASKSECAASSSPNLGATSKGLHISELKFSQHIFNKCQNRDLGNLRPQLHMTRRPPMGCSCRLNDPCEAQTLSRWVNFQLLPKLLRRTKIPRMKLEVGSVHLHASFVKIHVHVCLSTFTKCYKSLEMHKFQTVQIV